VNITECDWEVVTVTNVHLVYQATDALGVNSLRGLLFIAVALVTVAGLRLASRAVASVAEMIKTVVAAGLGVLLIAAATAFAFVLAITSI
jgi:hypothetical protein